MICDFAEIYHVFDWRALPLRTAAVLAAGFGPQSRSEGARMGLRVPVRDYLMALCADRLALFLCADGTPLLAPTFLKESAQKEETGAFRSAEEFEAWRSGVLVEK